METFLPKLSSSRKKIIVFIPHKDYLNYLLYKFHEVFKYDVEITLKNDYLFFEMEFDKFIDLALSSQEFTEIEMKKITILPLDTTETFGLSSLRKARTFEYWANLQKAAELDFVLQNESLTIFFQPIVNCKTGEVVFHECLARGVDQNGKLIAPAALFDLAKKLDVLVELSELAVTKALTISKEKGVIKPISINFPPGILLDPDFVYRKISDELEKLEMKLDQIILELTENEKEIEEGEQYVLSCLKNKGMKIAIDDAGNGFSSLEKIVKLKPNMIKIDMKLVRDIEKDRLKRHMVEALAQAAKKSHMQVIAEGVETIEEYKTLRALGIDLMQGYLFAKPCPEPIENISWDSNLSS